MDHLPENQIQAPKMPFRIKEVCRQIEAHPGYRNLDQGTLFSYISGRDNIVYKKQSHRFIRQVWNMLYLGHEIDSD